MIELSVKAKSEVALGCTRHKEKVSELFEDFSDSECRELMGTLEKLWERVR